MQANEPRLLAIQAYLDDERRTGPVTRGLLDRIGTAGVRVSVKPRPLGGFARLPTVP